jgi:hypothetical protein
VTWPTPDQPVSTPTTTIAMSKVLFDFTDP